jgi:hypothetical protein
MKKVLLASFLMLATSSLRSELKLWVSPRWKQRAASARGLRDCGRYEAMVRERGNRPSASTDSGGARRAAQLFSSTPFSAGKLSIMDEDRDVVEAHTRSQDRRRRGRMVRRPGRRGATRKKCRQGQRKHCAIRRPKPCSMSMNSADFLESGTSPVAMEHNVGGSNFKYTRMVRTPSTDQDTSLNAILAVSLPPRMIRLRLS